MCQSTKSLRSSPLRGVPEGWVGNQLRGELAGVDIRKIQAVLGHDKLETTALAVASAAASSGSTPHEFIRRFLIHVLPKGFHRIRHYGLFANGNRADAIARARELLSVPPPATEADEEKDAADDPRVLPCPCPRCGGRMIIIETFAAGMQPTSWPAAIPIRIDTS
jgi:hypothetical protein